MIRILRSAEASLITRISALIADFPAINIPTYLDVLIRKNAYLSLLRHPIAVLASTGILTSCPSASPFGYTLGPD